MKKTVYVFTVLLIITALLTGCSELRVTEKDEETTETTVLDIDFQTQYADIADEGYCKIASDGSYIILDSSPYGSDNISALPLLDTPKVIIQMERINSDLGFTEELTERIKTTDANQGKQTEENERYRVTWSFDQYNGMEIVYEKK